MNNNYEFIEDKEGIDELMSIYFNLIRILVYFNKESCLVLNK